MLATFPRSGRPAPAHPLGARRRPAEGLVSHVTRHAGPRVPYTSRGPPALVAQRIEHLTTKQGIAAVAQRIEQLATDQ